MLPRFLSVRQTLAFASSMLVCPSNIRLQFHRRGVNNSNNIIDIDAPLDLDDNEDKCRHQQYHSS